jgi:alanine-synthesizing transaminase
MFADRTNWNLSLNRLAEALEKRRAQGLEIIDLTVSNPTESGFVYDEENILAALSNPAALKYEPNPRGRLSAREAVAEYYRDHGATVPVDDIFLTTSTSEAYSYVFRTLCNPGDELLIPEPSYPLFDFLADIQDVKLVRYPLIYDHGWQIDFHSLEQAIASRTRGIIIVHPNNPTGHFCKPAEMAKLSEICEERQLAIIADEVFLDFGLKEERCATFAANSGALTFTLSGISKICGLPQMKVAWVGVSGPKRLKELTLSKIEVISDTYLSLGAPSQLALPVWLGTGAMLRERILERVAANLAELDRQLGKGLASDRLEIEGGWSVVLRVPAAVTDEELCLLLLETKGVQVHPGHFYGLPDRGFLVLSLLTPIEAFATGIQNILEVVTD